MFKKLMLAGTLLMGGAMLVPEPAQAQVYGPVIRYGRGHAYVPPVTTYRYRYSPYRYGYQPYFRGPAYGAPAYRGPVYRSYRTPYYNRYYTPRRSTGFSLRIGPVYRGW